MNHDEPQIRAHEQAGNRAAHEQAMEDTAARYFLDELSEAERDVFEEHFFDCSVCAETVQAGMSLADVPKPVPVPLPFPTPQPRPWSAWLSQVAAAVMAVTLSAVLYIQQLPHMTLVRTVAISMDVRGQNDRVYTLAKDEPLSLSFDVLPDPPYPTYEIGVRTAKGKTIDRKTISAEMAKEPQSLLLQELPAGSYELVIEGVREDGNRTPVSKVNFEVRR